MVLALLRSLFLLGTISAVWETAIPDDWAVSARTVGVWRTALPEKPHRAVICSICALGARAAIKRLCNSKSAKHKKLQTGWSVFHWLGGVFSQCPGSLAKGKDCLRLRTFPPCKTGISRNGPRRSAMESLAPLGPSWWFLESFTKVRRSEGR